MDALITGAPVILSSLSACENSQPNYNSKSRRRICLPLMFWFQLFQYSDHTLIIFLYKFPSPLEMIIKCLGARIWNSLTSCSFPLKLSSEIFNEDQVRGFMCDAVPSPFSCDPIAVIITFLDRMVDQSVNPKIPKHCWIVAISTGRPSAVISNVHYVSH